MVLVITSHSSNDTPVQSGSSTASTVAKHGVELTEPKINTGVIFSTGSWYSKKDCPSVPENASKYHKTAHRFEEVSSKPGSRSFERLVTSECRYCGGRIVDGPTIDV